MMEEILIRPMYSTDPDFRKGMRVAILKSTGEIIKRHYDNISIPDNYKSIPVRHLSFQEVDWQLAGYSEK